MGLKEWLTAMLNLPSFWQVVTLVLGIVATFLAARGYRSNKRADIAVKEAEGRYNRAEQDNRDRQAENDRRAEELRSENAVNQGIQRILEGLLRANIEGNDNAAQERRENTTTVRALTGAIQNLADSNSNVIKSITEFRTFSAAQHTLTRGVSEQAKSSVESAMATITENLVSVNQELIAVRTVLDEGSPYLKERLHHIEKMISAILETMPGVPSVPDTGRLRREAALEAERAQTVLAERERRQRASSDPPSAA